MFVQMNFSEVLESPSGKKVKHSQVFGDTIT